MSTGKGEVLKPGDVVQVDPEHRFVWTVQRVDRGIVYVGHHDVDGKDHIIAFDPNVLSKVE
ncbi:MAG: hypothetical protein J0L92_03725 [Deltaproteobacteria bacterium]|nr:hypothetical protein [Deltaproteobacteria bacterium]